MGESRKAGGRGRWEKETLEPHLKKHPERGVDFSSVSSLPFDRVYGPEDLEDLDYDRDLGWPGEYPFTRGVQPTMYRGRLWTMRMFAGMGTAEDTNARFKYLLKEGQTGLSTAFDLPTLMGRDGDSPLADGEVGKEGVAVSTLRDMEILFDGIPLGEVSTSMTINAPAAVLYAMYLAVAEKQGVPFRKLRGTIQNDIFKEYIAQKEWIYPPEPSVRLIVDTMEYSAREVPQWNTISISGYHIREAGSTAAQELAFTLADGIGYVQAGIARGLPVDEFAPRLSYFFNSHNDFFEEVAKLRAARRIWAHQLRERFGAKDPRSWMLRTHVQTAGCSLTAQQPLNNIVRVTVQALAAVLGGCQSLHTDSMDETLCLPSEQAVTVALRTQQILAEESGAAHTIDPLAGSYFVESLTNEMERQALVYIHKIDEMGGIIRAIEQGYPQREIAEASYRYQKQVESGEKTIVGVNKYVSSDEVPIPLLKISPEVESRHKVRLAEVKRTRDGKAVSSALRALTARARTSENLMPALLDCARAYCTLEETCDAMKEVFGEYREESVI
ncbi:MAG: methylmalonyl-CoA mutase family protein [Acidobacteriota bacterium]